MPFTRLSLKTRVNLIIATILALVVAIGSVLVIHHVRESVAEETRSALQLVRGMVEALARRGPLPPDQVQAWVTMLKQLSQTRHVRLVGYEQAARPATAPPPDRPVPHWFGAWVKPPPMQVEYHIPTRDGPPLDLVLIADPADEIAEAWEEARLFLGLILVLAGGCFAVLSWMLGRAFRPVDAVLEGLVALEREHYDHRLPPFPQPEWRRIARAFNHCAGVLERARADNRRLTRRLLDVEEDERRTLARELHDELGQALSGIKLLALSIKQRRPAEPVHQAACLIGEQVDHLFEITRAMIHRLRPLMLDDLGLCATLDTLVERWRRQHPDVQIVLDSTGEVDEFPAEHQIHLYRIVQEALTNAFRHGHPRQVHLRLALMETEVPRRRWLRIEIADDGGGTTMPLPRGGYGLRGMRERVESLGGRLQIRTAPGRGFVLSVQLPFEEEPDDHSRHACG
ncbi:MAG TPA: methanol utilization protein MoxY [Methylothermaceae bacterium]|nr:methanol utilization protein MoxY [Methylothermaceae bacterium]